MILPNKDRLLQDAIQSAVLFLHDKTWSCKDVHGVKVEGGRGGNLIQRLQDVAVTSV